MDVDVGIGSRRHWVVKPLMLPTQLPSHRHSSSLSHLQQKSLMMPILL